MVQYATRKEVEGLKARVEALESKEANSDKSEPQDQETTEEPKSEDKLEEE